MAYINDNKIKGLGGIKRAYLNNTLIFQSFKKDEEVISPYDITSTFNVTSTTSPTKVCNRTSAITEMYVDGVQIDVASGYTFNTIGNHTVGYTLPDKTTIGDYIFDRCSGLTSVKIIDSVTNIGEGSFYSCSGLTSIKMPSNVTSIGDSAFQNCISLTSVTIPSSVTTISKSTFYGCKSLESVTIPYGVTTIGNGAFQNCISLTSVTIPSSVTTIENQAFYGCKSLESVTIPSSVTSIGSSNNSFSGCYFDSDKLINNSSVSGYPWGANICDVIQEDGLCISGTTAVNCRKNATNVTIPDSVTSIKNNAFLYCTSLSSVTIGNGVTNIAGSTFKDCTSLQKVTIGSGVTSIGSSSGFRSYSIFTGCTSLTEITCLAPTAPTLLKKSIQGIENNNGVLYVQQGSDYSTWTAILTTWTIQFIT